MIPAVLELCPAAAHHAHHVGLREIAPAIFFIGAVLLILPLISDGRDRRRRERDDREDV